MSGPEFPLSVDEEARLIANVIAYEAAELWGKGVDFADMAENPTFQQRTADLVTPAIMEAGAEYDAEVGEIEKLLEIQVSKLIEQHGMPEEEARKIVLGELLQAFVQIQLERKDKEA